MEYGSLGCLLLVLSLTLLAATPVGQKGKQAFHKADLTPPETDYVVFITFQFRFAIYDAFQRGTKEKNHFLPFSFFFKFGRMKSIKLIFSNP